MFRKNELIEEKLYLFILWFKTTHVLRRGKEIHLKTPASNQIGLHKRFPQRWDCSGQIVHRNMQTRSLQGGWTGAEGGKGVG